MKKSLLTLAGVALFASASFAADAVPGIDENFANGIPANWTNVAVSGDKTFYSTSFTDKTTNETSYYAAMTGYKGEQPPFDAWLISPAVDVASLDSKVLTFKTQVNVYGSTGNTFKAYVLTSNDPATATKTELNAKFAEGVESGYSGWAESGELDLSSYTGTIYIGFNYVAPEAANYSTWCVTDVKLNPEKAPEPEVGDKGTLENPLTVEELLDMTPPAKDAGEAGWYVKGYIVGFVNGTTTSDIAFGAAKEEYKTNFTIAASSAEDEASQCLPVKLPKGDIRDNYNTFDHPELVGKEVILCGTFEKGFGGPCLIKTTLVKLVDGTTPTPAGGYTGLVNNADGFTYEYVTELPSEGEITYVWKWDEAYTNLKASAYVKGTRYATDVWAVSPVIDLTSVSDAKMSLSQAANFYNDVDTFKKMATIAVRVEGGEWTPVEFSTIPAGTDWTFVDSEEIALPEAFQGKKIQVGFRYTSTETIAGTWEVKNLKVSGTSAVEEVEFDENAPVEYYNLQGVRVANPENGLYIERRGNKARKILAK